MMRKSKNPARLDAYTDADWSGDSINGKSTSGAFVKRGSAPLREFTKGQSRQTFASGESEYYAGVDDGRGIAPLTFPEKIIGNARQTPIANRFNGSTRHHPTAGVRSSHAH